MLSTIATLETTIIQVTRSLFAMGRDRTLPPSFGKIHSHWRTPWMACLVSGVVALVLFALSNYVGSVGSILSDTINAIGLQIAFYYGFAALAVPIAYRNCLFNSAKELFFAGILPFVSAIFMFYVFVKSIPRLNDPSLEIGIGLLAVGVVPMAIAWRRGSTYFRPPFLVPFEAESRSRPEDR